MIRPLAHAKRLLSYPPLVSSLRIALGIVFIAASLDKIQHPADFAENIGNYRLVPYPLLHVMAIALPWVEIVTGGLLVVGVWIRANAALSFGLLLVFVFAISQALLRNLDISCGCFVTDPSAHRMTRWTLYWDLIWMGWASVVFLYDGGRYSVVALFRQKNQRRSGI